MPQKQKNQLGFTLIELLVVIAIIGILAALIIPNLVVARQKARDASRIAGARTIQDGLELYFDSNNLKYPTALADLVTSGFLPVLPTDPIGGGAYSYAIYPAASPTYYHLGISLERSDNPALSADKDCSSSGVTCPAGVAYTNGFTGADAAGCTGAASRYCYDLTP